MNCESRIMNHGKLKAIIRNSLFIIHPSRGFTLIELLVVVGIIGLLAALVLTNFSLVKERTRDAQRKQDLDQIRKALESYNADNNFYPAADGQQITGAHWGDPWLPYMAKVPSDPLNSQTYAYQSDGFSYRLYARLENCQDPQKIPGVTDCSEYNYSVTSPNIRIQKFSP